MSQRTIAERPASLSKRCVCAWISTVAVMSLIVGMDRCLRWPSCARSETASSVELLGLRDTNATGLKSPTRLLLQMRGPAPLRRDWHAGDLAVIMMKDEK
jgi:hypothetical protein